MNVYDSAKLAKLMQQNDYDITENPYDADVMLFNTCFIREKAAEKLFSDLGRYKKIKDERKAALAPSVIVVMGCVAQSLGQDLIKRVPFVDISIGPLVYHKLPQLLDEIFNKNAKHLLDIEFILGQEKFASLPISSKQGVCSSIAVQEGCNNFCAYCCVPYTRGREYSRPAKDVINEAIVLAEEMNAVEITLLGQNVNSYHGEGLDGKTCGLAPLILEIAKIEKIKRIRYVTSYPSDMSDELIDVFNKTDKLQSFLHLPIQSGSDNILQKMNRKYKVKEYLEIINKLRKAREDIAVSSDFIVGFPGETDDDFKQTLKLVEEVNFAQSFSFKYSPRPGTMAAKMENQVPESLKKERLFVLQQLLKEQQMDFNKSKKGLVLPILVENISTKGQLCGRTPYMQQTHLCVSDEIQNKAALIGDIVFGRIVRAAPNSLTAKLEE